MELKKTPEADLSRRTGLFFNIGLVVTLAIIVSAFEYRTYDPIVTFRAPEVPTTTEPVMDVPITDIPPPPPPQIQQPEVVEVPDEIEIEEVEVQIEVDIPPPPAQVQAAVTQAIQVAAPAEEETDEIFMVVEDQPTPPGGMEGFAKYLQKNLRYPDQARRMGIEGRVFVEFVVDKDGSITDVKAIKGIGAGCDEEAVRVVQAQPKWNPGKQRGRPVRVRMVLPIVFRMG
jgi:periplasmic protein TonB